MQKLAQFGRIFRKFGKRKLQCMYLSDMNLAKSVYQVCQQDTSGHPATSFFGLEIFIFPIKLGDFKS